MGRNSEKVSEDSAKFIDFMNRMEALGEEDLAKYLSIFYLIDKAKENDGQFYTEINMGAMLQHSYLVSLLEDMNYYMNFKVIYENDSERKAAALIERVDVNTIMTIKFNACLNSLVVQAKQVSKMVLEN